ncbi:ATP synthase subunit a [Hallella multisaccharivorax DSM 17128]|uniref:ATP synthase subunit a n=1 Tax=Hallella multisaccharivorax DSM 17128 TaxID=688246 RepID=F8N907_9BACT|nr:F0F1 ATP synthase subunit A [Hallella multisaccharivorax]EGN55652.1 ATP synthase F0 subcomplex A subunit [Hallella multisaccharivorax DSM 17128]GJG31651.1 ATP synthase subunit a [Hallella multisaccharivorax DSM 17128]
MRYINHVICFVMALFLAIPATASQEKSGKLNTSQIVVGHIKDSYDWHITDIGTRHIVINLPVIVKSTTGWHVFSTAKFEEEPDAQGYRKGPFNLAIATTGPQAGKIVELRGGDIVMPLDISITKTVMVLFIDSIILLLCILLPARWYRKHKASDAAPGGFTGFMEMLISWVEDNVVKAGVGEGYEKYSPYLLTCFFFIFTCNLMGLIPFPPGGGNLTGNIACTFFLALCTFIVTQFSGTKYYWKDIFWPEVPLALKAFPLIPLIEFVGIFTKPFALMIRLFANMMAGHAIALSLTCIIFVVASMGVGIAVGMSSLSILMSIFMMCLELLVCFIQSMVFTMLSATFIGLARSKGE